MIWWIKTKLVPHPTSDTFRLAEEGGEYSVNSLWWIICGEYSLNHWSLHTNKVMREEWGGVPEVCCSAALTGPDCVCVEESSGSSSLLTAAHCCSVEGSPVWPYANPPCGSPCCHAFSLIANLALQLDAGWVVRPRASLCLSVLFSEPADRAMHKQVGRWRSAFKERPAISSPCSSGPLFTWD